MSVYCVSDLHGNYNLFKQIKKILKPKDTVYVLGDCADRGKHGWRIITEVMADPRFIYLKGNHEDMLMRCIQSYSKYDILERSTFYNYDPDFVLYKQNGGKKTFQDWEFKTLRNYSWIKILKNLPERLLYVNKSGKKIYLTHAGFTPGSKERDYLWDRYHYYDEWPENYDNVIVVHGHTPIPYLMKELRDKKKKAKPGAYWYANDHKVCIDCGTYSTDCVTLLNLDTFNEIILMGENCVYANKG